MKTVLEYRLSIILSTLFILFVGLFSLPIDARMKGERKIEIKKERQRFPYGCNEHGYHFRNLVLFLNGAERGNQQSVYFMHNISNSTVRLNQIKNGDEPYIVSENNSIRSNQWGVFAMNQKQIRFFLHHC